MLTPEKRAEIAQWVDDVNQTLDLPPTEHGYEEKRKEGAVVHKHKPKGKKNGHARAFDKGKAARGTFNMTGGGGREHAAIEQFQAETDEEDSETELGDVLESSRRRMQRQILNDVKKGWGSLAAN